MNKANAVIGTTELFLTAWGLWMAITGASGIWLAIVADYRHLDAYEVFWFRVSIFILHIILPVSALASAYGLFKRHAWGRITALIVCLILLAGGLYTAVVLAVVHIHNSGALAEPIPEGAVIVEVNDWPTMVNGLLAGLLSWLLVQKFVKRAFTKGIPV